MQEPDLHNAALAVLTSDELPVWLQVENTTNENLASVNDILQVETISAGTSDTMSMISGRGPIQEDSVYSKEAPQALRLEWPLHIKARASNVDKHLGKILQPKRCQTKEEKQKKHSVDATAAKEKKEREEAILHRINEALPPSEHYSL